VAGLLLVLVGCLAGLALAQPLRPGSLSLRLLFGAAWGLALVVGTATAAGALGQLRPLPVAAAVIAGAAGVVAAAVRLASRSERSAARAVAGGVGRDLGATLRAAALLRHPELAVLGLLAAAAGAWAFSAAYWLPPRSVDDLAHHLTPVFEAAARGRFALLPLDVHPWYAYPLNADLLSLWPALFSGSIRWCDGAQLVTGPVAVLAAFAVARQAGASARAAAAPALALVMAPFFVRHAASAYTDITVAAFFGIAAAGALAAAAGGGTVTLLLFGLGAGLLAGTKYHVLFAIALLLPLAAAGIRRAPEPGARVRAVLAAALPAALLGAFWYARNLAALGNPFFPYSAGIGPLTLFPGSLPAASGLAEATPFATLAVTHPASLATLVFGDIGAGGLDGGLGPLFWGATVPLGLAALVRGVRAAVAGRAFAPLALPLAFFAGLAPYLAGHGINYAFTTRFLLMAAVSGAAFVALGLDRLASAPSAAAAARAGLVAVAACSILPLGGQETRYENKQRMRVGEAAALARAYVSPWRPAFESEYGVGRTAPAWDLLDLLSVPPGRPPVPLWVYVTGRYPAPAYGSRLTNRVWNSGDPARPPAPDAFLYYLTPERREDRIEYSGGRDFPLSVVAADPERYELALAAAYVLVYLDRARLASGREERTRLADYYENALGSWVALARSLDAKPERGVILAPGLIGQGLKALELRGELSARVVPARPEDLPALMERFGGAGPVFVAAAPGTFELPVVGRMKDGERELVLQRVTREQP